MKKIYSLLSILLISMSVFGQLNQLWTSQYNNVTGNPSYLDNITKVISDGAGNIYVTGISHNNVTTIKYDVNGNQIWLKTYNGPYNGADAGNSLVLDNLGNLYVVGYVGVGTGVASDMLTLKYDVSGNFIWARTFTGITTTGYDQARAVTCDATGNIYVTGKVINPSAYEDMTTLKYDPNGNLMWSKVLNHTGLGNDCGMDIELDNAGNVFVSGYLSYTTTLTKAGLVKYDNAGTQQFAVTALGNTGYDYWGDILITSTNQVFVAGAYDAGGMGINGRISRYNPTTGAQIWETYYNTSGGGADEFRKLTRNATTGDLYVSGNSRNSVSGNTEMLMAKYDSTGVFQWAKFNTGSATAADGAFDVVLDGTGNIWSSGYVENSTGSRDFTVVEYNAAGTQLYFDSYNNAFNNYDEAATMVYYNNAVYVAGFTTNAATSRDYFLVRYNTSGSRVWTKTYFTTPSPSDISTAVTTDVAGNIYIAGTTSTTASSYNDILVLKYNAAGAFQWQYTHSGTAGFMNDNATGIAVDGSGNVYVSGYVENTGTMKDGIVIKLNASGALQWTGIYNNPAQNKDDVFNAVRVDPAKNVYVTGYTTATASSTTNILTVKYDVAGVQQWAPTYNGTATTSNDVGNDLEVDAAGNTYVVGKATFTASQDDIMAIKYSSTGAQTWAWNYLSSTNYNDVGKYIRLAPNGDFYVAGYKSYSSGLRDMITIRYSSATGATPSNAIITNTNGNEEPYSLAVDASNNVYVSGSSSTVGMGTDMLTVAYSATMVQKWVKTKSGNSSPISNDIGSSVSVNTAAGKVYSTGVIENGPLQYKDMAIVVYDTLGNELNYVTVDNAQNTYDYPTMAVADTSRNIAVVGWFGWNTDADILISKYCSPASVGSMAVATASVCPATTGVPYTVNAVAGASSYNWSYGGTGVTITGSGPSVTIDFSATATSDTLYVSAVNACGAGNPLKYYITIKPKPTVNLSFLFPTGNDTVCTGKLESFHPSGVGYTSLLWMPGNYTNTGNRGYYIDSSFTVTIIGTSSGGCTDTASIAMTALPVPVADYTSTFTTITPGSSVNYTNTSTGSPVSFSWSFTGGVPDTSTAMNPSGIVYPTAGSFTTQLIVTNSFGCPDTVAIPYYVNVSGPMPPLNEIYTPSGSNNYYMEDGAEAEAKSQLLVYNDTIGNGYVTKIDLNGNPLWTKKFIGLDVHYAAVADSNHYYIASIAPKAPAGNFTVVTQLDQDGNVMWQNKYDNASNYLFQVNSITGTQDNGALMLVEYDSPLPGAAYGYVAIRLDAAGNVQWAKTGDPPMNLKPAQIMETMSGDVMVLSAAYPGSPSLNSFLMVKYDAAGMVQWSNSVGCSVFSVENVHMHENADSTFILMGDDGILGPGTSVVVAKADSAGNGMWVKSIEGSLGYFYDAGLAVQADGDIAIGYSFLIDHMTGTTDYESTFGLFGFDANLDTMLFNNWLQGTTRFGEIYFDNFWNPVLKPMHDGDFAVYSTYHEPTTDRRSPIMMRAYIDGNFAGCYQDTVVPYIVNRTLTNPGPSITSGTLALAAVPYSCTFGTLTLSHVSCDAVVLTGIDGASAEGILMKLFPNPTSAEINVVLPENAGTINIYNSIGSLVRSFRVNTAELKIDFSEFNDGLYMLEWLNGNKHQVSRVVKQ